MNGLRGFVRFLIHFFICKKIKQPLKIFYKYSSKYFPCAFIIICLISRGFIGWLEFTVIFLGIFNKILMDQLFVQLTEIM